MNEALKGPNREMAVPVASYFSKQYFSMAQLCSLIHQFNDVMRLEPKRVLEVGPGNGFLSVLLRKAGVEVTTVDINPELSPDIVSSISDLPLCLPPDTYCLVVCAEVLEHLPFSEFLPSIRILRQYAPSLYLTLPQYRQWWGFSGWVSLLGRSRLLNVGCKIRRNKPLDDGHVHFWELDQTPEVSRSRISKILRNEYPQVTGGAFKLNKYHEYFICQQGIGSP